MTPRTSACAFLIALSSSAIAQQIQAGIESLPSFERRGIEKLAALTAVDHSTLLFTIENETVGFARDGAVGRIGHDWKGGCNRWTHPALSHDGARVAYVSADEREGQPLHDCRIAIYDFASGSEWTLLTTSDDPGEISWSWDDSRIVYMDRWGEGLSEVSVATLARRKIPGGAGRWWVWYPTQWLHNERDLVIERSHEQPTGKPNEYTEQSDLFRLKKGSAERIAQGESPSVSPRSDRIAYFDGANVAIINADGTGKRIVARNPRTALFFRVDLAGPIVWSPDGEWLLFRSIEDEYGSGRLFMLDLESGKRSTLLRGTTISVRGWSAGTPAR